MSIRPYKMVQARDDKILTSNGVENGSEGVPLNHCCIYKNCSSYSFANLLANITSDKKIYISTDLILSSVMRLTDLKNISIIGCNNPTVQCGYSGGLHFVSCHNVTIEGITWDQCGTNANVSISPGAGMYINSSSNINFQDCTFLNSLGQSVVLSEVSGSVNINNCQFTHNKYYNNHGTAIYYSSTDDAQIVFMISNCTFDYNEGASIVYLHQSGNLQKSILLQNSKFTNNQGVPIYIIHQQIYIKGLVLFEGNNATKGGGLFVSNHASVIFEESSVVIFTKNVATFNGGAIFVCHHSKILYDQNSTVLFNSNTARGGGAVFSKNDSNITIKGNSDIQFIGNSAAVGGGALLCSYICTILLAGNCTVTFTENNATYGGVIANYVHGQVIFDDNARVIIINNSATKSGGAVYCAFNANILSKGNSIIIFITLMLSNM